MEVKIAKGKITVYVADKVFEFKESHRWPAIGFCCVEGETGINFSYFDLIVCRSHYRMPLEIIRLCEYKPFNISINGFVEFCGECLFCGRLTIQFICYPCALELLDAIYDSPDRERLLDGSED